MDIPSISIQVPMTRAECLAVAQCMRDSIITLAQTGLAKKYRAAKRSTQYDAYILQTLAHEISWMRTFSALAGEQIDMVTFREELSAALCADQDLTGTNSNMITFEEAAKLLHKSVSTIKRWRDMGRSPEIFVKIGAAWYVDRTKLQAA
ncbi:helix-turn-helix domain-containing protein [Solidesulfovibrio alcoholivorans]|uniref:helix-turn-helix domain-containing protein n=1 Tax=Solidesulfovibrio alcoholivorans TaxID=81406 RepID=UPI0009FD1F12|nr:helix-turn-helix domain-containing protein [Solidesulfovibrio alcoholivorans]